MQVKCEYCGSYIEESEEFCKQCGAVNPNFKRAIDGTPKTIADLKKWYEQRNLPPKEVTRFFIGENFKGPRAFGIYEENGEYIVYKNKDDGSRAERYRGKDEAYAVNEIYLKLKSEILNQKAHNIKTGNIGRKGSSKNNKFFGYISAAFVIFMIFANLIMVAILPMVSRARDLPYRGNYYSYDNEIYYCNSYVNDDWYWYDYDSEDYIPVSIPAQMSENLQDYKFSDGENWDSSIERFEDTQTGSYVDSIGVDYSSSSYDSDSSSDSDYSWDSSDSWDSDWGSDWDSDW